MVRTIKALAVAALLMIGGTLSSQATTIGIGEQPCAPCTITTDFTLPVSESISILLGVLPADAIAPLVTIQGGPLPLPSTTIALTPSSGPDGIEDYTAVYGALLAGSYVLTTSADAVSLSGNVSFGTSDPPSTPIPGSLALFLGGLGLIGIFAWTKGRRSDDIVGIAATA